MELKVLLLGKKACVNTAGHWEEDTVYSTKGGSKENLLTLMERNTRMELIIKIPDRTARFVNASFDKIER